MKILYYHDYESSTCIVLQCSDPGALKGFGFNLDDWSSGEKRLGCEAMLPETKNPSANKAGFFVMETQPEFNVRSLTRSEVMELTAGRYKL